MNRIITISREFGSGGRTVGKLTAEKLGLKCWDEEFISRAAQESGYAEDFIREHGEFSSGRNWFENALASRDYSGFTITDWLWQIQSEVVREIAAKENCVIVGRCADYLLRDDADLLKVFIHASMEKRIERVVSVYGESSVAPEKRLRDKDKKRRAYYQNYTDMKWGDMRNYHIALDSGVLGVEKCAEILCELY